MTSSEKRAKEFLFGLGYFSTSPAIPELTELLDKHAAKAIKAHEKKKWEKYQSLCTERLKTINAIESHLAHIDERECSLNVWNAVCDALGESQHDE